MDQPTQIDAEARGRAVRGLACGLTAYGLWGVLPVYFKALGGVSASAIVAHRIVWSLVTLGLLVMMLGQNERVRAAFADRKTLAWLALSAGLIAVNWLLYVYAINSGHILAGSLGYYLNPLANILLGRFLLREPLNRMQWIAVALAGCGVAVLASGALDTLWLSLTLCFSFAIYGLIRKQVAVDSLTGLMVETILLFPFALAWLVWRWSAGEAVWGTSAAHPWLLVAAGVISTAPLLLFTEAARRLPYSTVGMLQFVAPTLQFGLAVAVYGERITPAHAIAFAAIWAAVALYVTAIVRRGAPLAG